MVTRNVTIKVKTVNQRALRSVDTSVKSIERSTLRANGALFRLSNIAGAVISALALKRLQQYSDAWVALKNRLRQVTDSTQDLNTVTEKVFQIAQQSRSDLTAVGSLYFRLSQASENLGVNQKQALAITESLSNSLAASGLVTGEVNSVLLQTSQAFNKGFLNGDEFRTLSEAMPAVLTLVAKELGVARSELNKYSEESRITGQVIANALIRNLDKSREVLNDSTVTIAQSLTIVGNSLTKLIGIAGETTGISEMISMGFVRIADSFTSTANVLKSGLIQDTFKAQFNGILFDINFFINAVLDVFNGMFTTISKNASIAGENLIGALTSFGPSLRFAIQAAVVEIAGFIDKAAAFGTAVKQALDFTDGISPADAKKQFDETTQRISDNVDFVIAGYEKKLHEDVKYTQQVIENSKLRIKQIENEGVAGSGAGASSPSGAGEPNDGVGLLDADALSTAQQKSVDTLGRFLQQKIDLEKEAEAQLLNVRNNSIEQAEANELVKREKELTNIDNRKTRILEKISEEQFEKLELEKQFEAAKEQIISTSETRIANLRKKFARQQVGIILSSFGQLSQLNEKSKGLQRVSIVANTADAVMKSYNNAGGYPWGLIPAGIMAAIGVKQLSQVGKKNISPASGGGGGGSSSPGITTPSLTAQSINTTVESTFQNEVLNELRGLDNDAPLTVDFTRRIIAAISQNTESGVA